MYLTRGQPVVYYGDEQGFTGDGGDKDARQDMFASQVDVLQRRRPDRHRRDDGRRQLRHRRTRSTAPSRDLADLREDHPALADGAQLHRYATNNAGVYAFSRIEPASTASTSSRSTTRRPPRRSRSRHRERRRTFRQVWPAHGRVAARRRGARVTLTVPPLSAVVYRAGRPLDTRRDAPALHFEKPARGWCRRRAGADPVGVPDGGFNQVTFAWRPVGASDWTAARHRRQRAVPRLPRPRPTWPRTRWWSTARCSATAAATCRRRSTWRRRRPDDRAAAGAAAARSRSRPAVSMPGSHNSEIGCPGDWQPDCDQAQMTLDANDLVWKKTVTLPAGGYEYKAAINKSWDENYGAGGAPNGPNIPLAVARRRRGDVLLRPRRHWVTTDARGRSSPRRQLPERARLLGRLAARLHARRGSRTPTATAPTRSPPRRSRPAATRRRWPTACRWDENYGAGGVRGGANIAFDVPAAAWRWCSATTWPRTC